METVNKLCKAALVILIPLCIFYLVICKVNQINVLRHYNDYVESKELVISSGNNNAVQAFYESKKLEFEKSIKLKWNIIVIQEPFYEYYRDEK